MGYIYKLVDETELRLAQEGFLSLSRPIFSFKGSEDYFIKFAKDIYERYQKEGLTIVPKEKDLKEIRKSIEAYQFVFQDIRDEDLRTDFMIIFCRIMSTYCGYFTKSNLDDPAVLDDYRKRSHLKDKIAYIRIDDETCLPTKWKCGNDTFAFEQNPNENPWSMQGYKGYLSLKNVEYSEKYNDYTTLLTAFKNDPDRSSRTWFTILKGAFSWQEEARIIFRLGSLEPNSRITGSPDAYSRKLKKPNLETQIFAKIVDAINYASKGPTYIYLIIDPHSAVICPFAN